MVSEGDAAPSFNAPLANGDVEPFDLDDAKADEAPIVLAFFPAAFTSVCSHELSEFQHRLDEFAAAGATVYGVSVDLPFALNEFRDELDLSFGLISDSERELIDRYDVSMDFASMGVHDIAKRAVFVVDADGTVSYAWVSDDAGVEPNYDEVEAAAKTAAGEA
jgi:peroxiredoxin